MELSGSKPTLSWAARSAAHAEVGQKPTSQILVPGMGLEPIRAFAHDILSVACLPIPPPRQSQLGNNITEIYNTLLYSEKLDRRLYMKRKRDIFDAYIQSKGVTGENIESVLNQKGPVVV